MNNLQISVGFNKNFISFSAVDMSEPIAINGLFAGVIGDYTVSGQIRHSRGSANIKGCFKSDKADFVLEGKIEQNNRFYGFLTQATKEQEKKINVSGIWDNSEIIFTSNALNAKITKQMGGN